MFKGRIEELGKLQEFMTAKPKVLCLYGRTGMGKTSLLKEFLKNQEGCYFCAYPTTKKRELSLFAKAVGAHENASLVEILNKVTQLGRQKAFVLIIDGYGAFAKADPSFAKTLHDYVKVEWADTKIKLILCEDSYLNATKLMTSRGAIWQEFDPECMELLGLSYYEAQLFFMDALPEEKVFYYGITGGVPVLLNRLENTVEETITNLYLSEDGQAYLPERVINTELREMSYYNCLLETLASGKNRVNQISGEVEKPKDVVVPYLTTLMNIGVVKKENPVTEPNNRKKTRYSIVNTSDVFWYRYIVPHMDEYTSGVREQIYEKYILEESEDFLQKTFVDMCKDYLHRRSDAGDLNFHIEEIGNWWENDDEKKTTAGFDLVAIGEQDKAAAVLFARCFYQDEKVGMSDLKQLIDLTKHLKVGENIYYVIFSKSGFDRNAKTAAGAIKNIVMISLDEVCSWKNK